MDRHTANSLDHYLTTDPRDSEPEPEVIAFVVTAKDAAEILEWLREHPRVIIRSTAGTRSWTPLCVEFENGESFEYGRTIDPNEIEAREPPECTIKSQHRMADCNGAHYDMDDA